MILPTKAQWVWLTMIGLIGWVGCGPGGQSPSNAEPLETERPLTTAMPPPADAEGEEVQEPTQTPAPDPPERPIALANGDPTERVLAKDVAYLGAFRLPSPSGGSNWEYSAYAMTYYPKGDPKGPKDGFPGSIFAVGHDHHQMISEISIPSPIVSQAKRVADLPIATTLQPFTDVRGGLVGELEIPRAGLEYLPALDSTAGKLHFCWGQHFQFERDPSHGWCDLTLTHPNSRGLWKLGDYTNYVTNDYLFEIPDQWARHHLPGYRLVTGRFRDGHWGGRGPALLAYSPPKDPTTKVAAQVKPLVMYGRSQNAPELEVNERWQMAFFSEADEWSGGAWLTRGDRQAVVLVGTKGTGDTWYGFSNGVVYPTSGDPNDPIPKVPDFPHDARGWWSKGIAAQMIFFDVDDLAKVARGQTDSWTPQPFATLSIDKHLFEPGYDHMRQKRYLLGACCFDRQGGRLFVAERQVQQDEERSLIHVFQVK